MDNASSSRSAIVAIASLCHACDRLDLHQLLRVPEERDAEQRARGATQLRVDDVPDGDEVGTFVGDDVNRRLEEVLRPRVRLGEGEEQVLGGANGLRAQV